LRHVLGKIKGKFLLTYNDVPVIRKLYAHYRMKPVKTRYTVPRPGIAHWRVARELIITNY
jgi:DNA adenine methylase